MPTEEIKGGIFLLISGLLLITPGFFTDCIGFAVFLKPVQNIIATQAKNILTHVFAIKGSIFFINSFKINTNF